MEITEYDNKLLISFYAENGLEFNEKKGYFGMDVKSLSEILGHANVNMTLNRYVHSSYTVKKKFLEKL